MMSFDGEFGWLQTDAQVQTSESQESHIAEVER